MDYSLGMNGDHNAAFITLKPGIAFQFGRGSYVADAASAAGRVEATERQRAVAAQSTRGRLLGVFDERTGAPIAGGVVTDSATGTSAATTATGTISLGFLTGAAAALRVDKPGYGDSTLHVTLAPADTTPITLVLRPRA
jgi:hypothetical protein